MKLLVVSGVGQKMRPMHELSHLKGEVVVGWLAFSFTFRQDIKFWKSGCLCSPGEVSINHSGTNKGLCVLAIKTVDFSKLQP